MHGCRFVGQQHVSPTSPEDWICNVLASTHGTSSLVWRAQTVVLQGLNSSSGNLAQQGIPVALGGWVCGFAGF